MCHSKLLAKLRSYGIHDNLFVWMEAFLHGRSQSVRIGEAISAVVPVINGVPQRSVLGSTFFLLYINDIADIFNDLSVSLSLFADDLKLYTYYKLDAPHNDLQMAIDRLIEWASLWQLQLAPSKCSAFRVLNPQGRVADDVASKTYDLDGVVLPLLTMFVI